MVAESICVHSDTPGAVEVAKAVHAAIAITCNRRAARWMRLYQGLDSRRVRCVVGRRSRARSARALGPNGARLLLTMATGAPS